MKPAPAGKPKCCCSTSSFPMAAGWNAPVKSDRSLRTYQRNVYDKLDVHSNVQAMVKALAEKIID